MRWILIVPVVLLFASCEALREWASSQPAPGEPVPPSTGQLPQVGGADPLDLVVTVLTMLGLLPAARLVAAGRPFIVALVRALLPKKAETPTQPPQP